VVLFLSFVVVVVADALRGSFVHNPTPDRSESERVQRPRTLRLCTERIRRLGRGTRSSNGEGLHGEGIVMIVSTAVLYCILRRGQTTDCWTPTMTLSNSKPRPVPHNKLVAHINAPHWLLKALCLASVNRHCRNFLTQRVK